MAAAYASSVPRACPGPYSSALLALGPAALAAQDYDPEARLAYAEADLMSLLGAGPYADIGDEK